MASRCYVCGEPATHVNLAGIDYRCSKHIPQDDAIATRWWRPLKPSKRRGGNVP